MKCSQVGSTRDGASVGQDRGKSSDWTGSGGGGGSGSCSGCNAASRRLNTHGWRCHGASGGATSKATRVGWRIAAGLPTAKVPAHGTPGAKNDFMRLTLFAASCLTVKRTSATRNT